MKTKIDMGRCFLTAFGWAAGGRWVGYKSSGTYTGPFWWKWLSNMVVFYLLGFMFVISRLRPSYGAGE